MKWLLLTQEGGHLFTKVVINIISDSWMAICAIHLIGGMGGEKIPYEATTPVGLQGC